MNKRGFTLIELITVIAILAVLGTILMPNVSGYVGTSKDVVCNSNVNMLNRIYRQAVAMDENLKPQDILNDKTGKYFGGLAECPSNGDYIVVGNTIECTIHKGGSSDLGGGTVVSPEAKELYDKMLKDQPGIEKCKSMTDATQKGQCYTALFNTHFFSNDVASKKYYDELGGSWKPLGEDIKTLAGINGTYYVRPYYCETGEPLLFASQSNVQTGAWHNVPLVYYNGSWYKCKSGTVGMNNYQKKTAEEIKLDLYTNFEKIT